MTEAEWLACEDPREIMAFLGTRCSDRQTRLVAAACCRRVWILLTDGRCRRAVEVAEAFVDGAVTGAVRAGAEAAAVQAARASDLNDGRLAAIAAAGVLGDRLMLHEL